MKQIVIPFLCIVCMLIGAMGANSWESESIRAELRAEKEAEIKELQGGYTLALKPITTMCSNAAFRSVKAVREVTTALRTTNRLLEANKVGNNAN